MVRYLRNCDNDLRNCDNVIFRLNNCWNFRQNYQIRSIFAPGERCFYLYASDKRNTIEGPRRGLLIHRCGQQSRRPCNDPQTDLRHNIQVPGATPVHNPGIRDAHPSRTPPLWSPHALIPGGRHATGDAFTRPCVTREPAFSGRHRQGHCRARPEFLPIITSHL